MRCCSCSAEYICKFSGGSDSRNDTRAWNRDDARGSYRKSRTWNFYETLVGIDFALSLASAFLINVELFLYVIYVGITTPRVYIVLVYLDNARIPERLSARQKLLRYLITVS